MTDRQKKGGNGDVRLKSPTRKIREMNFWRHLKRTSKGSISAYVTFSEMTRAGETFTEFYECRDGLGGVYEEIHIETDMGNVNWNKARGWNEPLSKLGLATGDVEPAICFARSLIDVGCVAAGTPEVPEAKLVSFNDYGRSVDFTLAAESTNLLVRLMDGVPVQIVCDGVDRAVIGVWSAVTKRFQLTETTTWKDVSEALPLSSCGFREEFFGLIDSICEKMVIKEKPDN